MGSIALATMTYDQASDPSLQYQTMKHLADTGHVAVVADGGSSVDFVAGLRRLGHEVISTTPGPGTQQRAAIGLACKRADGVLWFESNKLLWVESGLEETLAYIVESGDDVVVVARPYATAPDYPEDRVFAERGTNTSIGGMMQQDGDYVYGPKYFSQEVASVLESVDGDLGWGTTYYLLGVARALERTITVLETGASHDQREGPKENESDHRIYQGVEVVNSMNQGRMDIIRARAVVEMLENLNK